MFPKEVEVILARHLASSLIMPIFIVDVEGNLIYYNEPAEHLFGRRFEETGQVPGGEWTKALFASDEHGVPLDYDSLPLSVALVEQRPAQSTFWIRSPNNVSRQVQVTAVPLVGQAQRKLGAMAFFWEIH